MKNEISMHERKKIILDILIYIDNVARRNNIKYSLGGGTLLGAVRHKGFIPWDDDADLMLARPEYEKLIKILRNENKYTVLCNEFSNFGAPRIPYLYTKIVDKKTRVKSINYEDKSMGIFVDIFPIDGLPDNRDDQIEFRKKIHNDMKEIQLSNIHYYWIATNNYKKILKILLLFPKFLLTHFNMKTEDRIHKINKEMSRYSMLTSKYAAWMGTMYGECYPASLFSNFIDLKFEGHKFMAISNYKYYLTNLYGNYMRLPPKNKRTNHSFYKFYWR